MEFIKPTSKAPAPGKEVDAYCGKCKLELAHIIVAMNGQRIARVECKTCHGVHAYRGGPPAPRKATSTKGKKPSLTQSEYDRLMAGRDITRAAPYKPVNTFEPDAVLSHPTFGIGVVTRVLADQKIEVGFPVGVKVLVHSR